MNPFTEAWYTGDASFDFWLACELVLVASTAFGMFMEAPYGKHASTQLGSVQLSPRFGWWLMEAPATVSFVATFLLTPAGAPSATTSWVLAALWCVHYANRGWYFPLNIRASGPPPPSPHLSARPLPITYGSAVLRFLALRSLAISLWIPRSSRA